MPKRFFITAIVLIALAATTGSVIARDGSVFAHVSFETLDADGDGRVTSSEMRSHRAARIAEADEDGDGLVSLAELQAAAIARASARAARHFDRMDANGDGMLSTGEMTSNAGKTRVFDRMDRDGDGVLSRSEFERAHARVKERRADTPGR